MRLDTINVPLTWSNGKTKSLGVKTDIVVEEGEEVPEDFMIEDVIVKGQHSVRF